MVSLMNLKKKNVKGNFNNNAFQTPPTKRRELEGTFSKSFYETRMKVTVKGRCKKITDPNSYNYNR